MWRTLPRVPQYRQRPVKMGLAGLSPRLASLLAWPSLSNDPSPYPS